MQLRTAAATAMLDRFFGSKYELLEKIAHGGMAEVFLARARGGLDRRVAIKRVLPQLSFEQPFVEMFLQEAKLCARLSHPHIVETYEFGKVNDQYFIAMEYVEGQSLAEMMKLVRRNRTSPAIPVMVKIASAVAEALQYAHTATDTNGEPLNIVHRDISPSNILVSFRGDVKISDFGLARAGMAVHKTGVGVVKGKFAYMSPEQALAEPLDLRSDIFSLGSVLFEITTGSRLFGRAQHAHSIDALLEQRVPRPSTLRPEYPPELEEIVLRCLARDRQARYQDAKSLQQDLERYLRSTGQEPGPTEIAAELRRICAMSDKGNLPRLEAFPEETSHSVISHSDLAARRERYMEKVEWRKRKARQADLVRIAALVIIGSFLSWFLAYVFLG